MNYKIASTIITIFLVVSPLIGCSQTDNEANLDSIQKIYPDPLTMSSDNHSHMDHSHMNLSNTDHSHMHHSSSGEIPKGLKEAENPTYKVGSNAIIKNGHMIGMEGAVATIIGAYDTVAYVVSYDPINGGERVIDHKWVVKEEVQTISDEPIKPGSEVIITTDHMVGMLGSEGIIEYAEETTVYMIDFITTDTVEQIINHKWVVESELFLP